MRPVVASGATPESTRRWAPRVRMARRWVPVLGLAGALLCGGVSQTFLWRSSPDLAAVTGSQFTWVLLIFVISWAWARGRLPAAATAGALTGLALVLSYYALQWAADGAHSAVAQFTKARGLAWTLSAVIGGAAVGLCGGLTGRATGTRARAFGIMTPALVVGLGPLAWGVLGGPYLAVSRRLPVLACFVLAATALIVVAVRACGWRACLGAGATALAAGAVALGGLWFLETHGALYLTF